MSERKEVDLDAQHAAFNAIAAELKPLVQESRIRLLACLATLFDIEDDVIARLHRRPR